MTNPDFLPVTDQPDFDSPLTEGPDPVEVPGPIEDPTPEDDDADDDVEVAPEDAPACPPVTDEPTEG